MDERVFPDQEPGPRNPQWGDVVYDGSILQGKTDEICGFRLRIPCLKALNIPPEVLKELRKVAPKFPNDLLIDEGLLHAHLVWYDLIQAPELKKERSIEEARKGAKRDSAAWTVPVADWVECILAWPHYLRWTARSTITFFDDLGPLERAREGERGSGTASPGCRINKPFLGDQASGTILVDDVRQLTFSTAIVHKSYVVLILPSPHLASDVPFRVSSMALP
ncbi:hypothetical protein V8C43DRAFT_300175 [Trichoderma afarasin]